jgi:hypothetical protein
LLCLLFCGMEDSHAREIKIRFAPEYNGQALKSGTSLVSMQGDSFTVSKLKFYVSGILLVSASGSRISFREAYLLDMDDAVSLSLTLNIPDTFLPAGLQFNFGIDSLTNSKGAVSGALDATRGMYWAWHSGYINFKLEGTCKKCTTRKNEFQYHLGGFRENENCEQVVVLPIKQTNDIEIGADISALMEQLDLSKGCLMMTPGKEAVRLSTFAAQMFYMKP